MAASRALYNEIARQVKLQVDHNGLPITPETALRAVAAALKADNPRFDTERFMLACGL